MRLWTLAVKSSITYTHVGLLLDFSKLQSGLAKIEERHVMCFWERLKHEFYEKMCLGTGFLSS